MSPIEKVRARADAFEVLGLCDTADAGAIRAAWRRAAFEAHPDRNGGDYANFMRVKSAYDLVRLDGSADTFVSGGGADAARGFRTGAAKPSGARPRVATRTTPLAPETVETCRGKLGDAGVSPCGVDLDGTGEAGVAPERNSASAGHVPHAIRRHGRTLTYLVPTPLKPGLNRVCLPTAILENNRRIDPRVMTVRSDRSGAGEVTVPDALREKMFPNARAVRIEFGVA